MSPDRRLGGPLCPPSPNPGSCLLLCRDWQRKRGKELLGWAQSLAAKLLVREGGQSRALAPGRQPGPAVEKIPGTKESSRLHWPPLLCLQRLG